MIDDQNGKQNPRKPIRMWPGFAAAALLLVLRFGLPAITTDGAMYGFFGAVAGALAVLIWWLFFSRAPWLDRLGFLTLMIIGVLVTKRIVDPSIAGGGMGMLIYFWSAPVLAIALVLGAGIANRFSVNIRRASTTVAILLGCAVFTLIRTGGITADGKSDLHWRWTKTPEERLLAQAKDETAAVVGSDTELPDAVPKAATSVEAASLQPASITTTEVKDAAAPVAAPAVALRAEWPGFRGPKRDGIVRGVRIETDWSRVPPVQLWRHPVGPGWSSFAVRGDLCYTQEQRGGDEIVACYKVSTGEMVWRHRDAVRFYESNGGAGPRATPTLNNGLLYSFGATGILNALNAGTGAVVWSRNVASETDTKTPGWGFASSPLVVNDLVIVAADATLVAYDAATGRQRWVGPAHHGSYSSPHRTTINGVEQILFLGGAGAISVAPSTGAVLWEHAWQGGAIVQPALTADGGVLINAISMNGGVGTRRLDVMHSQNGWKVEERWTSTGLKPYFNDFVVHKGHAFGFDGNILACIDLEDGKRTWKGGRYGDGQLLLLPDQDLLLVLSEEGELALVGASPDQYKELTRIPALQGKTWNHPVLVGDLLLVRNGEEMAAYRLALAGR